MSKILIVFLMLFILPQAVMAQNCTAIFPDAVSNSNNGGSITLGDSSTIFGSPDNILDTRNLSVPTYNNLSCNGVICSKSNSVVPSGNSIGTPNGPDVILGYQQVLTLAPGNYGELRMGSESVLRLSSGDYTFRDDSTLGFKSSIQMISDGTARLWFRRDLDAASQATIGSSNSNRRIFMHSDRSFSFGSPSTVYATIYAERDIVLSNQARIIGAITAKQDVRLNSASYVTFSSAAVATTDYASFCVGVPPLPAPVAEYRLETPSWTGAAGQVVDAGPNGLNGRSIYYGSGYPTSNNTLPAISGDPGTCRYGIFNGTSSGHLRVEDNSLLDLQSALTVGVWIYPTGTPSGGGLYTIVSKDENFEFHLNNNREVFWWWGGGARSLTTSGFSLALNTWHHVAITYAVAEQIIYVNGVERARTNYNGNMTLNNDPLLIGTDLNFDSRNFRGRIDEVAIYDNALTAGQIGLLMNQTHPCTTAPSLGSFTINVGSGTGSVCAPKEISITARDTTGAPMSSYAGTVSINTSRNHGNWSATNGGAPSSDPPINALSPGANDSGSASYTYAGAADGGAVALFLSNQHAEQLTISVTDSSAGISSTSAALTFSANAFSVQNVDSLGADIVAGRDHSYRVDMLRRDPTTGSCGVASNYQVAQIKAWVVRDGQDPAGAAPRLRTASGTYTLPNTEPASPNVTFPFAAGTASYSLLTADVGKYTTQFKDVSGAFSDQPIVGDAGLQTVRPFAFDVQVSGNPGAVDASGPAYRPAGQNFTVAVRAVLWSAADDANGDGIADGHADGNPATGANLSNNTAAASFGREAPAEGGQLSAVLVAPAAGADPGLGNGDSPGDGRTLTSFTAGAGISGNVFYGEVGIIELNGRLLDGDYLAMGASRTAKIRGSSYVGRFYPANFKLTPGAVSEACGSFSYMEQAFALDYQLRAQNARPTPSTTTNYQGAFAKLGGGLGSFNYGARGLSQDLSSRLAGIATSAPWSGGQATVQVNPITFTRHVSTAPDGPVTNLNLGVWVRDADGAELVASDLTLDVDGNSINEHGLIGSSVQRFGRLYAKDAFGPESADIPMFWQTEYFDGTRFVRNAQDNCSRVAFSQMSFPGSSTSVDAAAQTLTVTLGGVSSVFDFSDPLGSQTCMTATDLGFCRGFAGVVYRASGTPVSYPVQVNLTNYPHLRFDWDANGTYSDTNLPQFMVNFQTYRGHDRVIFWRERL